MTDHRIEDVLTDVSAIAGVAGVSVLAGADPTAAITLIAGLGGYRVHKRCQERTYEDSGAGS